jgi:hypothetical protein
VEPDRQRVGRVGRRPPFATGEHARLVPLLDRRVARFAMIGRGLGLSLGPAQPLEAQPLAMATMRAADEKAPLVGGLVLPLDPRAAPDGRSR